MSATAVMALVPAFVLTLVRTEICHPRAENLTGGRHCVKSNKKQSQPNGRVAMKWFKTSTVKTWDRRRLRSASRLRPGTATAQDKELRVGYQPKSDSRRIDCDDGEMGRQEWGQDHQDPRTPTVSTSRKMTASLTSSSDSIRRPSGNNDDWGQLWAHLLEPTDDVEGLKYADKWGMDGIIFNNAQGQNTVVPMGQTFGVFYYRTDLVSESELPKTWDDLVKISKKTSGRRAR